VRICFRINNYINSFTNTFEVIEVQKTIRFITPFPKHIYAGRKTLIYITDEMICEALEIQLQIKNTSVASVGISHNIYEYHL
jgi:hypothetical protein